jgi:membrane-associated phospholipid phosphatase
MSESDHEMSNRDETTKVSIPPATTTNSNNNLLDILSRRSSMLTYRPFEWLLVAASIIVTIFTEVSVTPYCRTFDWNDATISYELKPDTVPPSALFELILIAAVILTLFVVYRPQTLDNNNSSKLRWAEINAVLLFLFHATSFNFFVTELLKNYEGRLRPDFISRLHHEGYFATNSSKVDFCSLAKTSPLIKDGRHSFPSGHSSISFFVCTCLTLYLCSRFRALYNGVFHVLACSSPMIVCVIISASRYRDNRHHPSDILAGGIIGFCSAYVSWIIHFVSVDEEKNRLIVLRGAEDEENHQPQLPFYVLDKNRDSVGDHIPRWFVLKNGV